MHQNTTKEDFKNNNSDTQSIDNEEETSVITDEVLQESTNIQEARRYEEAKGKQKLNNYQKKDRPHPMYLLISRPCQELTW